MKGVYSSPWTIVLPIGFLWTRGLMRHMKILEIKRLELEG